MYAFDTIRCQVRYEGKIRCTSGQWEVLTAKCTRTCPATKETFGVSGMLHGVLADSLIGSFPRPVCARGYVPNGVLRCNEDPLDPLTPG